MEWAPFNDSDRDAALPQPSDSLSQSHAGFKLRSGLPQALVRTLAPPVSEDRFQSNSLVNGFKPVDSHGRTRTNLRLSPTVILYAGPSDESPALMRSWAVACTPSRSVVAQRTLRTWFQRPIISQLEGSNTAAVAAPKVVAEIGANWDSRIDV